MKKILILGSGGMLGHMLYSYLAEAQKYQIIDIAHSVKVNNQSHILDITNKNGIESFIKYEKPDIVINCIGVLIKGANEDPSNAIYINSYFPHQLSKLLREIGGKLIHISTDCVFSGKKGNYSETDFRDSDDIYGRSKALGEVINDYDLTLRTSIIGPELKEHGEGLFDWFSQQTGNTNGFSKVYWGGVTTLELAKVIDYAIDSDLSGLVHVTNGKKISKHELLSLIKEIFMINQVTINPVSNKKADKSLICTNSQFQYTVPPYREMIESQYEFMISHKELYSKYF